jgi:hypothetical protein
VKGLAIRTTKLGFRILRLHYSCDPDKDPDTPAGKKWYDEARKGMSDARWRQEYEIDYGALGGQRVFPDFEETLHVVEPRFPIDSGAMTVWLSCDPHPRTAHAFLWAALGKDGDIAVVWSKWREDAKKLLINEYAEMLHEVDQHPFKLKPYRSSAPQSQTLLTVHGLVDGLYLEGLREKTFRGVEQLALQGLHTGGRVFGYRHVAIENSNQLDSYGRPTIEGVRLTIDANQAKTVTRIFERYTAGDSMKRIAIDLNRDGISSPQARPGRSQSWAQSSVRHILLNERYRGIVTWGRTRKIRSPETGKRIYRRKPENEWRRVEVPEQRIISEKLWKRTQERIHLVRDLYGVADGKRRGRAAASPYLFTGLLECSECGGSITIVSGRCRNRADSLRMLGACAARRCGLQKRLAGPSR